MDKKRTDEPRQREGGDPGPETVDPAPWLGQVGEGATLPSGEAIAREVRELTDDDEVRTDRDSGRVISGDPEMPIPDVEWGKNERER